MARKRQPKGTSKGGQFASPVSPNNAESSSLALQAHTEDPETQERFEKIEALLVEQEAAREDILVPIQSVQDRKEAWHQNKRKRPREDANITNWRDSIDCFLYERERGDVHEAYMKASRALEVVCEEMMDEGPREEHLRRFLKERGFVVIWPGRNISPDIRPIEFPTEESILAKRHSDSAAILRDDAQSGKSKWSSIRAMTAKLTHRSPSQTSRRV